MRQDQRKNIGRRNPALKERRLSLDGKNEDAGIVRVLDIDHGNPLASEEAVKADDSHGD